MIKDFETIVREYKEQVDKFNKKSKKITEGEVENAIFNCFNMISIQNDTIIRLLVNERLERENGRNSKE